MSVVSAAVLWASAGMPPPNWQGKAKTPVKIPETRPGVCALTGEPGEVWPLAKITTTFTAIDRFRFRFADPDGLALGPAGAWAVRNRLAMQQPHGVVNGAFRQLDPADVFRALTTWTPQSCVLIPQSRQKHLLPWAELGTLRTDSETLRWTSADVDRLRAYEWLRSQGFGETALTETTPRFAFLTKTNDPAEVLALWPILAPWRQHPAYLDVAARATRTPKDTDGTTTNPDAD